jgi:hypothetical protein
VIAELGRRKEMNIRALSSLPVLVVILSWFSCLGCPES